MEETFEASDGTFHVETYVSDDGLRRAVHVATGDEWTQVLTFENKYGGEVEFRKLAAAMMKAADLLEGA
jgi:hypothetical protein